jgi:hypothetical protein
VAQRWRVPVTIAIYLLLLGGLVLPHLGIIGHGMGRSLIPAGMLFSQVQIAAIGAEFDAGLLGLGINVGYLGIGLHQLGTLLAVASVWVLATEDINRWIYRIAVVGGWLLTASAPIAALGWVLIRTSGAPGLLGLAWLPALIAGLCIIIVAWRSRERIDRSWYVTKPELQ